MKRKQKIIKSAIIIALILIFLFSFFMIYQKKTSDADIESLEKIQEEIEQEKENEDIESSPSENQEENSAHSQEEDTKEDTSDSNSDVTPSSPSPSQQESSNSIDSNQTTENKDDKIETSTENQNPSSNLPETIEPTDEEESKIEETPIVEKTPEELNNEKRNQIMSTYNVTIKYGSEIGSYKPRGENPVLMTDSGRINSYLSRIEAALKVYPAGFFKEMKDVGMPVTFYLIERVPSNSFAGLTDKQYYSDIKITLTTTGFFERTLHHEIMHYIDCYLEIKLYPEKHYESYQALNPSDFVYGTNNNSYVFNSSNPISNYYFINAYAQQHVLEDRASLFEDLMARPYINSDCYTELSPLRQKAKLISEQIDRAYNSVSSSTYKHWERFIK